MSGGVIATAVIIPVIAGVFCLLWVMRKRKKENRKVVPDEV